MQRTACGDARGKINTNYAQAIAKNFNEKTVQVAGNIKLINDQACSHHTMLDDKRLFVQLCLCSMHVDKRALQACTKVYFMILIKTFALV